MSNFPQLFGQNSTILWSRHVVLMSMKLTMSKKRVFLMYSDHKVIYSAKTHLRIKWTSSFCFLLGTMAQPPRLGIYQRKIFDPLRGGAWGRPKPQKTSKLPFF